jgi:hypothetical protein
VTGKSSRLARFARLSQLATVAAVVLAVAVGIALGAGPLGGNSASDADSEKLSTASPGPAGGGDAEYAEAFAAAGAERLYANGLEGHAVAVLAMPGAETSRIKELNAQVVAAGGAITGTYVVADAMLDPGERSRIDSLGSTLMTQLGDPRVDSSAPTYERMGALIAIAMATDEQSSVRADLAAVVVRESLADAELLAAPADVRNAPLVLVVLPPGPEGSSDAVATQAILSGLVNGVATNATGVVVTGDEESAEDGELAALRESDLAATVSTVDGVETVIGRVTTVLALVSVVSGTAGAYGASGADGPVPIP